MSEGEKFMNNWQKVYCDMYHNGKAPHSKAGKQDMELLGKVKSKIIVEFPDFTGANGFVPAHTDTYIVTYSKWKNLGFCFGFECETMAFKRI